MPGCAPSSWPPSARGPADGGAGAAGDALRRKRGRGPAAAGAARGALRWSAAASAASCAAARARQLRDDAGRCGGARPPSSRPGRREQRLESGRSHGDAPTAHGGAAGGQPRRASAFVLTEGGPHLLGDLLAERQVDELFLTLAPQIAGRSDDHARLGLVDGRTFAPERPLWSTLASVKLAGSHLLLRYALQRPRE